MEYLRLDENRIIAVLNPLRKKRNLYRVLMCIVILGLICVEWYVEWYDEDNIISQIIRIGIAIIMVWVLFRLDKVSREYVDTYKEMISKYVFQDYFDDATYKPLRGFSLREFWDAHLIEWKRDFDYRTEDLISGNYSGVEFKQSDVKITHKSGKETIFEHTVVDVDGRLTCFQFEKDIRGRILIVAGSHTATLEPGLSKVEMEDVEFNKQFDVYASDAHNAYYLLTPHFMEYLKRLRSIDKTLYISFDGKKLYVLRSGKGGIFEPPSWSLNVREEVAKNRRELDEIRKLIEVLKLER